MTQFLLNKIETRRAICTVCGGNILDASGLIHLFCKESVHNQEANKVPLTARVLSLIFEQSIFTSKNH